MRMDKEYIHKKIDEAEGLINHWKGKLIEAEQIAIIKQEHESMKESKNGLKQDSEFLKDVTIRKIGTALEYRFTCGFQPFNVCETFASEYLADQNKIKDIDQFLISKGLTRKELVRREVTI